MLQYSVLIDSERSLKKGSNRMVMVQNNDESRTKGVCLGVSTLNSQLSCKTSTN